MTKGEQSRKEIVEAPTPIFDTRLVQPDEHKELKGTYE
jgi:hypothetical protein